MNKNDDQIEQKQAWLNYWNERYQGEAYAFGVQPNRYLEAQLAYLKPGAILLPAEGEGRNAVYCAKRGWTVSAFDISATAKQKAMQLAEESSVMIDYQVGELPSLTYQEEQFDAIALIYAHFPAPIKSSYHQQLDRYLKSGGTVIFEAFSKSHLPYRTKNEKVGGPRDLASLFSMEELKRDFAGYKIIEMEEVEIQLNEGLYHNGVGSVIRFLGTKH